MLIRATGFTAVELAITLTVFSLLMVAGAPSFSEFGMNQRMKSATASLKSDLTLARSEAVYGNFTTVACPGAAISGCSSLPYWENGWFVFRDLNGDRERQPDEPILREAAATLNMQIRSSSARRRLRFYPNGTAPGSNSSIRFCDNRGPLATQQIKLSNTGRIRQVKAGQEGEISC